MNNIIIVKLDSTYTAVYSGIWQWNYGQILRFQGGNLPKVVEVHFSLQNKGGDSITRIGTTIDGATDVPIPDSFLENGGRAQDYKIYAFIYLEDGTAGNTEYKIEMSVKSRPKPEVPGTPEEPELFRETVKAVNAAADRAEQAEQNAKASATEAGKYAASASESAVVAEKTKEDALRKVGEKKQEAIEAIQEQEETSVEKIINHTDNEIQRIQNQTADSKAGLEQTIKNADASKKELDESIQTVSDIKTALDKSVELAGTAKTELDTSIQKAGTAKNALDKSTETARTVQETLSATVKQAGALDTSLGEKIETGTQLNEDITASGEKAVQDIQTAGSEQLGKMQAVAEEFTADREQIAVNREDIGSLKEDIGNKITKFYASNQGETHLADSDNGKIEDMMIYGKSEQKQYKGINLFPPNTRPSDFVEVSIPKGSSVFWVTDGTPATGGNFRFFNEDKTEDMWLEIDAGTTSTTHQLTIDVKYVQNLIDTNFDLSKICLGIGSDPIYEPYTGGIPSPSPEYPQEIKSVVNPTVKVSSEDETGSQTVALPYTFNAIPVSSEGNVTIGKQQYISDYLDIEKGKLYRKVKRLNLKDVDTTSIAHGFHSNGNGYLAFTIGNVDKEHIPISNRYKGSIWTAESGQVYVPNSNSIILVDDRFTDKQTAIKLVQDTYVICALSTPTEEDLSLEQIKSLKSLSTNYPVTNITVGSEELDGYTVFNYPISMENGWNYVKQQLGDTRDYIYDMDAKAQDIDIQSAEAYVNSEYAVALTELEVM